jgi:hypothetical protein
MESLGRGRANGDADQHGECNLVTVPHASFLSFEETDGFIATRALSAMQADRAAAGVVCLGLRHDRFKFAADRYR